MSEKITSSRAARRFRDANPFYGKGDSPEELSATVARGLLDENGTVVASGKAGSLVDGNGDPIGGLADAPSDGHAYGRKDAAWVRVTPVVQIFATNVTDISSWSVTGGTASLDGAGNVTFDTPGSVTSISATSGFASNSIVDASICPALQTLDLDSTTITTPPVLTGLTALQYIYLNNTGITTPPVLTGLTALHTLDLSNTLITTPPVLTGLTALQTLYLNNTGITTPPVLTGLTALQTLDLSNTSITTPPDVTGLTALSYVRIDGCPITDSSALNTFLAQLDAAASVTPITGGYCNCFESGGLVTDFTHLTHLTGTLGWTVLEND